MPETVKGRQAIKEYLEKNEVGERSLAKMFGVSHQYLNKVLNGTYAGPKANQLILKIIDGLKI